MKLSDLPTISLLVEQRVRVRDQHYSLISSMRNQALAPMSRTAVDPKHQAAFDAAAAAVDALYNSLLAAIDDQLARLGVTDVLDLNA